MPAGMAWRFGIPAFVAGVAVFLVLYGPSQRIFVSPPRTIAVSSTAELYEFCRVNGLRGRRAVVFARHLIPAESPWGDASEIQHMTDLMHHGIVREMFHVVPERTWPEVEWNLANVSIYRPSSFGRVAAFEDGRVNVDRLSRYWPKDEAALVLVDPSVWSPAEVQSIARLIQSGHLRADLVAVLRGAATDVALWSAVVSSLPQ